MVPDLRKEIPLMQQDVRLKFMIWAGKVLSLVRLWLHANPCLEGSSDVDEHVTE